MVYFGVLVDHNRGYFPYAFRRLKKLALEAKMLTERWRREYNTLRIHSALRYRPPAPETIETTLSKTLTLNVVQ